MNRRTRFAVAFGWSLAACLSSATNSFAQSSGTAATSPTGSSAAARDAFRRGVEAIDSGQFDIAAEAFEQSYQLRAVPSVLLNLAIARRGQGRYRDAIAAFERYLANPGARATASTIAQANGDLQQLRTQLATVDVHAEPPGSTVAVDGQVQAGAAGALSLDPGRHTLEVSAEGFATDRRTLELRASAHETLSVRLQPANGGARVQVVANVATATISIDNVTRGSGHVDIPLPPGEHSIDVRADGYVPIHRTVRTLVTGVSRLDLTLVSSSGSGWVAPALIGVGVVVVGAGIAALVYGLTPPLRPNGSWTTIDGF